MKSKQLAFTAAQRRDLARQDGLTLDQITYLQRALRSIAYDLEPLAPAQDIADELNGLVHDIGAACNRVRSWEKAAQHSAKAVALGTLGMATASLNLERMPANIEPSGHLVAVEHLMLLERVVLTARGAARATKGRRAPGGCRAVEAIVEAINRPTDPASVAAARAVPVARTEGPANKPSFRRLADTVFAAATSGKGSVAGAEWAIRKYLKRLKANQIAP